MNKLAEPKAPASNTEEASLNASEPRTLTPLRDEVELIKTEETIEPQKLLPAPKEIKLLPAPRNPMWDQPHGPGGFAVEKVLMESEYKTFVHTKQAKTIDGYTGDGVIAKCVSIKTTGWYGKSAGRLNVYKNISQLGEMSNYQVKILHVCTPPGFRITNLPQVTARCAENGVRLVLTHL